MDKIEKIEGISDEVNYVFEISSLVYVWGELEKVIPDFAQLVEKCWIEHYRDGRKQSDRTFFLKYGVRVFNPIINRTLKRHPDYLFSFDGIMRHALKDAIRKNQGLHEYLRKMKSANVMESEPKNR
jgi:hypothetical protein